MTRARTLLLLGLLPAGLLLAAASGAQDLYPVSAPLCEPPISTCQLGPIPLGSGASLAPSILSDTCPTGTTCTCVPSCPTCADCDAQVCLRNVKRPCRTACDCPGGLACFQGQCLPGIVPVFCCDEPGSCPAGEMCEYRQGGSNVCPDRPGDRICAERRRKAGAAVAAVVKRSNYCRMDSDCVRIDDSTRCGGTCGAFVNGSRARRASRLIDRIDTKICSDYTANGCPLAIPGCLVQVPACIDHRCVGIGAPPPLPLPTP